jgi:hypothetical protein
MRPEDIAPHEQFRIRMVDAAMKRIARHPNWYRGYGFSVGAAWWPEFLASLAAVRDELQQRIEREVETLERQGRAPAAIPQVLDVMTMAVFLLLAGRKAAWPLPVMVPLTFEAMGRFVVAENARVQAAGASECDGVEREKLWVSGEMAGVARTVH